MKTYYITSYVPSENSFMHMILECKDISTMNIRTICKSEQLKKLMCDKGIALSECDYLEDINDAGMTAYKNLVNVITDTMVMNVVCEENIPHIIEMSADNLLTDDDAENLNIDDIDIAVPTVSDD